MSNTLDVARVLTSLKDFQRRTVDYAFHRMFLDSEPAKRFLVADEVGLGKTLVARGLIAKFIEHSQNKDVRIDVIYVCSNADIAAQNMTRLKLPGLETFAKATRLTLLPLETKNLKNHKVNFISFTPGTTFDQGNRTGRKDERHLIYQMLREIEGINTRGLRNALQGTAGDSWFQDAERSLDFDHELANNFRAAVTNDDELFAEASRVAEVYHDRRRRQDAADNEACLALIGKLRQLLAKTCLSALEPDLVILDEFQRFRELLASPDSSPSAELAHALFNYINPDLRILLLSATPYKMYSKDGDEEDHYADFLCTMKFLHGGGEMGNLEDNLKAFRTGLLSIRNPDDVLTLRNTRREIEASLLKVMCRTERVSSTIQQDAMIEEVPLQPVLTADDLDALRLVEIAGQLLGERDTIEYWKSSPYLLNFMRGYQLKLALERDLKSPSSRLPALIEEHSDRLLSADLIQRYATIDPANARLRAMVAEIEQSKLWQLLWMPPSLPYWQPAGVYEGIGSVSKHLVFSAWNVVPDAIAAMLSYEVERLMVGSSRHRGTYEETFKRYGGRLRFSHTGDGRFSGMNALMLMFPSPTLAGLVDPLSLAVGLGVRPLLRDVRDRVIEELKPLFEPFLDRTGMESLPDRRWYWVALAKLESSRDFNRERPLRTWCMHNWARNCLSVRHPATETETDEDADHTGGFANHVKHWMEAWEHRQPKLGRVPDDFYETLANLALAGPAVCALRSLKRTTGSPVFDDPELLDAAVRVAEGLRSQFNTPTSVALLQATDDDDAYWQRVLQYGCDGNLQSLLDEHAHVLAESHKAFSKPLGEAATAIANDMFEAMSIRTATLSYDEICLKDGKVSMEQSRLRCHYAMRFGQISEEQGAVTRKETVKAAFNSPFRPFVLASTSVGQEGLDFHTWCHSIVHWNLPTNPVDMEQREGRVHRYKGYAVRKNVARSFGKHILQSMANDAENAPLQDPWHRMFTLASKSRRASDSDLIPYWIFEAPGGDKIQRRVFSMPYSRDESRYKQLRKSLSMYRLVFAQPRQEDLLAYLVEQLGENEGDQAANNWRICVSPPELKSYPVQAEETFETFEKPT